MICCKNQHCLYQERPMQHSKTVVGFIYDLKETVVDMFYPEFCWEFDKVRIKEIHVTGLWNKCEVYS